MPLTPAPTPDPLETAHQAFQQFSQGLATGDWDGFLAMLSDDFWFWFPVGPFQGRNVGKARAAEFFRYVSQLFEAGLSLTVERMTASDTTVVFEARSQGQIAGQPYQNQVAISFDVRQGQICAYREYLGVILRPQP